MSDKKYSAFSEDNDEILSTQLDKMKLEEEFKPSPEQKKILITLIQCINDIFEGFEPMHVPIAIRRKTIKFIDLIIKHHSFQAIGFNVPIEIVTAASKLKDD